MRLRRLTKCAAALLLIGVAMGGAWIEMRATDPAGDRYRVTLTGGTTFEVVAIAAHPTDRSWRPDGTPLGELLADDSGDAYSVTGGQVLQMVLARVKNLPDGATVKWVPTYDQGCYTYLGGDDSGGVTRGGRRAPDLLAYIVAVRPDRTTGSVKIQFAAGPWKTEVSDNGRPGYTGITKVENGHQYCFSTARPYRGGTTITVAHNLVDANLHLRLVAVDRQGKEHQPSYYADSDAKTSHSFVNHLGREHPANYSSGGGGEFLKMLDTEFSLPPDQIQEFRVQSRPFERAEIKNIALQPRPAAQ